MEKLEISKKYAKAFYDFISSKDFNKEEPSNQRRTLLESTLKELEFFLQVLKKEKTVEHFLFSPVVEKTRKKLFLKHAFDSQLKEKLSESVKTFIFFLNNKQRLALLEPILHAFKALKAKEDDLLQAKIHFSQTPLDSKEKQKWKETLTKKTKKSINLELKKDPALMAGIKIEMHGFVIEDSLSYDLKDMEAFLRKEFVSS